MTEDRIIREECIMDLKGEALCRWGLKGRSVRFKGEGKMGLLRAL